MSRAGLLPGLIGRSTLLYSVELSIAHDLGAAMAQMRSWLDHHQIEVSGFRQIAAGAAVSIVVMFKDEAHAAAFASTFSGRLLPAEPVAIQRVKPRRRARR